MKYDDSVPGNFLLLRFVVTRYCNYRCPYCYVPEDKIGNRKSMFSHHGPAEWVRALERFGDRHLELYFTGGEPTLIDEFPDFLAELVRRDFVKGVRIDSNLSRTEEFAGRVRDPKVRFLASFHPTRVSGDVFLPRVERLRELGMMGMVNVVASRENVAILGMAPHELADLFEGRGCFLNVAKDFHRGLRTGYDPAYREYVDSLQHPADNAFMNGTGLTTGRPCGPGKHYLSLSRHGRAYSCGGVCHGGLFDGTLEPPAGLLPCREARCPSIISYSFSSANDFSPVLHLDDYVRRNRDHRAGLDRGRLAGLWRRIVDDDLMPKEAPEGGTGETEGRISRYARAIRRALPGS